MVSIDGRWRCNQSIRQKLPTKKNFKNKKPTLARLAAQGKQEPPAKALAPPLSLSARRRDVGTEQRFGAERKFTSGFISTTFFLIKIESYSSLIIAGTCFGCFNQF